MGKIGLVSAKYIIHAQIVVEGVVERPDIVGAIFGQTEGLLGSDLELRELQRNGKIGRIEISVETKNSKTSGEIIIPSSLDKTETALIAAILETIEKIGPCTSKVNSTSIEDVRTTKRDQVVERAKELLKDLTYNVLPDSMEITEKVADSVRLMDIVDYGKEKLAAGPMIDASDEIIIVEGRADVINLLKNGIKNSIAMNGTSVPKTIKDLSKLKTITAFVDGDRGGDLIIKELIGTSEIDFVAKAPDGKEVEELTKKELNKALRSRIPIDKFKLDVGKRKPSTSPAPRRAETRSTVTRPRVSPVRRPPVQPRARKIRISKKESDAYKEMLDELVGTRGAYILDKGLNILGKVPTSELSTTMKNFGSGIHAVVFDGTLDLDVLRTAERARVKCVVAMDSKVDPRTARVDIIIKSNFT
jgi:DNA primase